MTGFMPFYNGLYRDSGSVIRSAEVAPKCLRRPVVMISKREDNLDSGAYVAKSCKTGNKENACKEVKGGSR